MESKESNENLEVTPTPNKNDGGASTLDPITLKFLQEQHIYFALPMYGGMCSESTFAGLVKFAIIATKLKINFTMDIIYNESLIPRARNNLVAKFMGCPEATHLMFIDVDLAFDPEAILKLLCNNQDVVGGLYPKKSIPISYVVNLTADPVVNKEDLVEVDTLGTGFMLVKRHVFERMFNAFPELKYRDSLAYAPECEHFMYALYDTEITEDGTYLSEDWAFCLRWKRMGGRVFANPTIKLDHTGFYKFQGDPAEIRKVIGPIKNS